MPPFSFGGSAFSGGWLSLIYGIPTVVALVDYFRRRPEGYWFWIIIFFPTVGPIIYLIAVVLLGSGSGVADAVSMTFRERRRRTELEAAVERGGTPGHFAELGELYYKEGRYDKAIHALTRAIETGIDHDEARFFLGRSYEKTGAYEKAVENLVKVVRHDPNFKFGEAFLALGRSLEAAGQTQDAAAAYQEVLKNHTYAEARLRLALLYEKQSRVPEARSLMEQIVLDAKGQPGFIKRREAVYVSQAKAWLSSRRS